MLGLVPENLNEMSDPISAEDFKGRLRLALSRLGISQAELGRRIDAHPNLVNSWVSGKCYPSFRNLAAMAPVLEIDIDWLVLGRAAPPPLRHDDSVGERVRSLGSELIELVELARETGD